MLFRDPFIWLCRFRHRRGYGVHSPFAYDLITQVLYCPGRYYDDGWLELQFPWWVRLFRLRPLVRARLLFRLANRWQADILSAPGGRSYELAYLHAGCRKSAIVTKIPDETVDFLYLRGPEEGDFEHLHEGSMLVIGDLKRNRKLWREVCGLPQTRVTFDLYDFGIAFFDPKLQPQHYIVNW